MERLWQEVRAGWLDVRWSVYFLLLLLPGCLLATALAAVVAGTLSPSPALLLLFGVPAALIALIGAGLWEGPRGRLGSHVWFGVLLITAYLVLRQLLKKYADPRSLQAERQATVRLAGHQVQLLLSNEVQQKLADRKFRWRDMFRLHQQPLDEGMHRVLLRV
jgi:hypothetical protein